MAGLYYFVSGNHVSCQINLIFKTNDQLSKFVGDFCDNYMHYKSFVLSDELKQRHQERCWLLLTLAPIICKFHLENVLLTLSFTIRALKLPTPHQLSLWRGIRFQKTKLLCQWLRYLSWLTLYLVYTFWGKYSSILRKETEKWFTNRVSLKLRRPTIELLKC